MWSFQFPWKSNTQALSMSSRIWIVLSDFPSVYGWNDLLNRRWVSKVDCKLCQNVEVKRGSLSDTIEIGTPCNLTISHIYKWLNVSIESETLIGRKWADFVKRSTTTQTTSCSLWDLGNSVTKFIMTCSYFHSTTGNGCNKPAGLWCSAFTCWQVKHLFTNLTTSDFIPFHQ